MTSTSTTRPATLSHANPGDFVLRIVVSAAIIAISRRVISFRLDDYGSGLEALLAAAAFAMLGALGRSYLTA